MYIYIYIYIYVYIYINIHVCIYITHLRAEAVRAQTVQPEQHNQRPPSRRPVGESARARGGEVELVVAHRLGERPYLCAGIMVCGLGFRAKSFACGVRIGVWLCGREVELVVAHRLCERPHLHEDLGFNVYVVWGFVCGLWFRV